MMKQKTVNTTKKRRRAATLLCARIFDFQIYSNIEITVELLKFDSKVLIQVFKLTTDILQLAKALKSSDPDRREVEHNEEGKEKSEDKQEGGNSEEYGSENQDEEEESENVEKEEQEQEDVVVMEVCEVGESDWIKKKVENLDVREEVKVQVIDGNQSQDQKDQDGQVD